VWQTIRAALEVLWVADRLARERESRQQGDESETEAPGEEDPSVALATAQTILAAADITLPTGDLAQGVYDALGNYYSLPETIVSDPTNMDGRTGAVEGTTTTTRIHDDGKGDLTAGEETAEELDEEGKAARRREEKGKAVVDVRNQITLRARLSDGSHDVTVAVGKTENVRSIARRVAEEAQVIFSPSVSTRVFASTDFDCPRRSATREQKDPPCLHGEDS
jgi:hypothetical protein